MHQALSNDYVDKMIEETQDLFRQIGKGYKRGFFSSEDCHREFYNAVIRGFYHFLWYRCGVTWRFNSESWPRFLDDRRLWTEGRMPDSAAGEPWLFCDETGEDSELGRRISNYFSTDRTENRSEACPEDKAQFFLLMEAYHMPPAQFAPVPGEIVRPDRYQVHSYADGDKYIIGFPCADDGGLTGDAEPVGKNYVLRSELDLRAEIRILEVRSEEQRKRFELDIDDFAPAAAYLAEGRIEGYTSGRIRTITVRTDRNGKIEKLGTVLRVDDAREFDCFPLWQEYIRACDQRAKAEKEGYDELFRIYCLSVTR